MPDGSLRSTDAMTSPMLSVPAATLTNMDILLPLLTLVIGLLARRGRGAGVVPARR